MNKVWMLLVLVILFSGGCATVIDAYYVEANRSFEASDYVTAAGLFEEFVIDKPDSRLRPIALYKLGQSYQVLNHLAKAKASYQVLVQEYPNDFWANLAKNELKKMEMFPINRE